jgi:DNA (cytosine-5)-methyltransferase 1
MNTQMSLKCIDFFSGIGGIRKAFENNNIHSILSIDNDEYCKTTSDLNFNLPLTLLDINNIDENCEELKEADVYCMGSPCQPYSIAGERKGLEDKRSVPFIKVLELIKQNKPKCVFVENVKNLSSHNGGNTFKYILSFWTKIIDCYYKIINTYKYSILPQNRERLYLVCFIKSLKSNKAFTLDDIQEEKCMDFNCFLEENVDAKYFYSDRYKMYDLLKKNCTDKNCVYQYRRTLVRQNKKGIVPCLTSNMGGGGHNVCLVLTDKGIRKLTPRECFNLQGFPKDYKLPNISDSHLYKQIGNSVSIPIIDIISKKIYEFLAVNPAVNPMLKIYNLNNATQLNKNKRTTLI